MIYNITEEDEYDDSFGRGLQWSQCYLTCLAQCLR